MTLVEQFEKYRNEIRPYEPYSESENPEQWVRVLAWQEGYTEWLETKLQNTSSNSDYAKCNELLHSGYPEGFLFCPKCGAKLNHYA